jgi:hypothetical protein
MLALLLTSLLAQSVAPDADASPGSDGGAPATAAIRHALLEGVVEDERGRPVANVPVFALPAGTSVVTFRATSARDGSFRMSLPAGVRHDLGVMSSRWLLVDFDPGAKTPGADRLARGERVRLTVRPSFPEGDVLEIARAVKSWVPLLVEGGLEVARPGPGAPVVTRGEALGIVEGTVRDQVGSPLAGVRILSMNMRTKQLVASTESDGRGRYRLVTRAGHNRLTVHAPGLRLHEALRTGGRLDFVLAIETQFEDVVVRSGRRLSFRIDDSVAPDAIPPQAVMATLLSDYRIDVNWYEDGGRCFCPGDLENLPPPTAEESRRGCRDSRRGGCIDPANCPVSVWQRQCKLPRYWWLRLLQIAPPPAGSPDRLWWEPYILDMQREDARAALARP